MSSIQDVLAALGEQVRQLRIAEGMSQADLADRANVGVATVQRLESGSDSSLGTLIAIARVLDRLDWFDEFDPVSSHPTPMEVLRQREGQPARPRRVGRRHEAADPAAAPSGSSEVHAGGQQ